jgi:GNAT superfamily N-acetyltransferase
MYSIEPASFKDIPVIIQFQVEMARETEDVALDAQIVEKGVNAVFNDPSKGSYYVAKFQDDPIACLLTTPEWSEWRNGTVLWIQSVYVKPEHRGKGIFRKLYQHIQDMVDHNNSLRGIRLYVDNRNTEAKKVYQALGMDNEHYQLFEWMKK